MADVRFDPHPDRIDVLYTGTLDFASLTDLFRVIVEQTALSGHKCVLLDITGSTGGMSVGSRYVVGNDVARRWDRSVRLALLMREEQLLPDRFWVTVMQNRGLTANVFIDRYSALQWLLE